MHEGGAKDSLGVESDKGQGSGALGHEAKGGGKGGRGVNLRGSTLEKDAVGIEDGVAVPERRFGEGCPSPNIFHADVLKSAWKPNKTQANLQKSIRIQQK